MFIGTILIQFRDGQAQIVRHEPFADGGTQLVPAANTASLAAEARAWAVNEWQVDPTQDGICACPIELIDRAEFVPLTFPDDAIPIRIARDMLYPGMDAATAWAQLYQATGANRLLAYKTSNALAFDLVVSRAAVERLTRAVQRQ